MIGDDRPGALVGKRKAGTQCWLARAPGGVRFCASAEGSPVTAHRRSETFPAERAAGRAAP